MIIVEPVCYFIDALLVPAIGNANTSKFFNREIVDILKKIGGDLLVVSPYLSEVFKYPTKKNNYAWSIPGYCVDSMGHR